MVVATSTEGSRSTEDLFLRIKTTMPPGGSAELADADYLNVVAYILRVNGSADDSAALSLEAPRIIGSGEFAAGSPSEWQSFQSADTIDVSTERVSGFVNRVASEFTPVSKKTLAQPPAGDWVSSGKLLWQSRLAASLHGFPISYSAKGKQYVAVPTGLGVFRALTAVVSPAIYQPQGGNALYVFELVDSTE